MPTELRRPLPVDIAVLRQHYLPAEPDTAVTRWRATIARIDTATAAVHAEIDEADQRQRGVVTQLVELAHDGRDMGPVLKDFRPARAHAEQRLYLLGLARSLAVRRLTEAEHTDRGYVAWRAECQQVTTEWQLTGSADTPEQRYTNLLAFAAAH